MKQLPKRLISFFVLISLIFSLLLPVSAAPSAEDIITTPSGYTTAADVSYNIVDGYVTNWGARGEDCTFLTTYAQSYYTDGIGYDDLSQLSGGTSTTDAPDSELYAALQSLMVDSHTTFTKYGGSTAVDCKNFYQYTDCMLGDISYVSTLYRGLTVGGAWDGGVSYNQEHVWPQSKCIGTASEDIGDIMQLRPANPSENSSRNNTAYGESEDYYDPGVSVRGDCARTLLYLYTRWGNTGNMWGTEGVMESLEILLRWIAEDPVDTWEMGHNDAVQSITGVRNVFVDYPEYAWLLFGQAVPSDILTPSGGDSTGSGSTGTTQTATLVTDASSLKAGDTIIIVAADYDYALSTEQKTNNRGQAAVTKNGSTVTFGADVQTIQLQTGTTSGTFGFYTGEGYLSAVSSSSNNLKTNTDLTDNGSWSITIDSTTGVAAITASGTYTRNTLRYNSSSTLFSCYAAENSQKDVLIYRLGTAEEEGGNSGTTATLVTDASSLKAGDTIIIVAADYDYALSTEQKTNNRGQAAVTKNGSTVTFASDVQTIQLQTGTTSGTFGFYTGEGYLSAVSSSANNLKTNTDLTDNGSWSITIDSTTGVAAITASGTYTRNTLRYNSTSTLFSCYATENSQKDVQIYRLGSSSDTGTVTDPALTLKYPSLSFEDEIFYNVYFTVDDMSSVVEMGLMLLSSYNADATIDDAIGTVPGYVTNGTMYMARSQGVAAAYMGDTVYFKVYAKLSGGTYAYSGAGGYNAKAYANTVLGGDYTSEMKSLVVAMVDYGAEAQLYFGHNTSSLVNASLTTDQKALVSAYDESMVDAVVPADSAKTTDFVRVNSNFSSLYPSVSFDSAFSINFYCTPAITVDNGMTLYYWDAETYDSISKFSVDNATGSMEMTESNGQYWGNVPGIAAKDMDKTYYVSCVFESEGETITTGIIPYSLGKYCEGKAATDGDAQHPFAQATAVYGYYAKQYFASIA